MIHVTGHTLNTTHGNKSKCHELNFKLNEGLEVRQLIHRGGIWHGIQTEVMKDMGDYSEILELSNPLTSKAIIAVLNYKNQNELYF